MNIKCVYVFGYSELVVNQVKNKYGIKKCRLKAYAKKVWDLINRFQAFNVTFIHWEKYHRENSLAITASMFSPGDLDIPNSFKVSILYRAIVPDNEGALQVFENDERAHFFLVRLEEQEE